MVSPMYIDRDSAAILAIGRASLPDSFKVKAVRLISRHHTLKMNSFCPSMAQGTRMPTLISGYSLRDLQAMLVGTGTVHSAGNQAAMYL